MPGTAPAAAEPVAARHRAVPNCLARSANARTSLPEMLGVPHPDPDSSQHLMSMLTSSALTDIAFPAWRGASAPGRRKTPLTASIGSPDRLLRSFQTQSTSGQPSLPGGQSTHSLSTVRTTAPFKPHKPTAAQAV